MDLFLNYNLIRLFCFFRLIISEMLVMKIIVYGIASETKNSYISTHLYFFCTQACGMNSDLVYIKGR